MKQLILLRILRYYREATILKSSAFRSIMLELPDYLNSILISSKINLISSIQTKIVFGFNYEFGRSNRRARRFTCTHRPLKPRHSRYSRWELESRAFSESAWALRGRIVLALQFLLDKPRLLVLRPVFVQRCEDLWEKHSHLEQLYWEDILCCTL